MMLPNCLCFIELLSQIKQSTPSLTVQYDYKILHTFIITFKCKTRVQMSDFLGRTSLVFTIVYRCNCKCKGGKESMCVCVCVCVIRH